MSAGRLSKSYDNNNLWQSTCSSYSANLLIKSFANETIPQKIRTLVHEFREPKLDSLVQRFGGSKLQNFPDTRFCYARDTSDRILNNLHILQKVALIEDVTLTDNVMETIFGQNFKNALTNAKIRLLMLLMLQKCGYRYDFQLMNMIILFAIE